MDEINTPYSRNKFKEEINKWINENISRNSSSDDNKNYSYKIRTKQRNNIDEYNVKTNKSGKELTCFLQSKPLTMKFRRLASEKHEGYIPECENYFTINLTHKSLSSDYTLNRPRSTRLPTHRVCPLPTLLNLSNTHGKFIKLLFKEYKKCFTNWIYILNEGYNIILYGLGSKRSLLQTFQLEILSNQSVVVVNGFFPGLTVKDILDAIANDCLDLNLVTGNYYAAINIIEEELSFIPQTHLFLIVHNIDGTVLRNSRAQGVLCRLAKIPNIHLIASIDYTNIPLLWSHSKLSSFNFAWWDMSTMLPYSNEIAYENSLLMQTSGKLALSSLTSVFLSLTTNGKKIFIIIAKNQLKNKESSNYFGMQFRDLYWTCRESFLISSDLALRAQLTEFIDHKLIKTKRTIDGSEYLIIPIKNNILQQFLDEQKNT